jgi:hypothetical protein
LAIAEDDGVRQAAYALKLLQSDGELTIASTGKDDATGNLVAKQYTVKGPVILMLTTTAIERRRGVAEPVSGADDQREPRADA